MPQPHPHPLTINQEVVIAATVVGGLVGHVLGQDALRYHQVVLLPARRMNGGVAELVVALGSSILHRHGELAEGVSVGEEGI